MSYKPNFIVPPLPVLWGDIADQPYRGWHLATIASKTGLNEYVLIWNVEEDKYDLWYKIYTNPEDPSEHKYEGGVPEKTIKEIIDYFGTKDIWPIIENCAALAREQEENASRAGKPTEPS